MTQLQTLSEKIATLAPAGFYVALRVGFSFPSEELNQLPETWVLSYTRQGMVVHDPVLKWVYANTGSARLDALGVPDPHDILMAARGHGLIFGIAIAVMGQGDHGRRSYGTFYRGDRDFAEPEIDELHSVMAQLHDDRPVSHNLTLAEIEALRFQSEGLRLKQIAALLGISESAVKARLNNAKRKLGARTPSQAATLAAARRIL